MKLKKHTLKIKNCHYYSSMMIESMSNFLKFKLAYHRKKKIFYLRAIIHLIKYFLFKGFRKNKCLIDPPLDFFYKYINFPKYFSLLFFIYAKHLKKKKIFISINNSFNSSTGHIYCEISNLHRLQKLDERYSNSTIWFTTSRKEILSEMNDIFRNKNFKILFGGIKRLFLTFVALRNPFISIDGSISSSNLFFGKNYSHRYVYHNLSKQRGRLLLESQDFYPNQSKLNKYLKATNQLMKNLNISEKYIIIQIKTEKVNGTMEPLNPELLLKSIEYFQDKNYQIVFAGREKFPDIFLNKSIINYANSKYASPLNDFLIVGHSTLVIASASGFCFIPENFDKPLLILNAHHIGQNFGKRTIYVPTLLSRRSEEFNARIQHKYLCTYGAGCGYDTFDDMFVLHMPTSDEILMAGKELEEMLLETIPSLTPLQKKISDSGGCPLLSFGLSRISDYYLTKHGYFFGE